MQASSASDWLLALVSHPLIGDGPAQTLSPPPPQDAHPYGVQKLTITRDKHTRSGFLVHVPSASDCLLALRQHGIDQSEKEKAGPSHAVIVSFLHGIEIQSRVV